MSTMKKLFALVLALAMLMSVSVFAYEDSDDIAEECYDAVELLSAIGLIKGDNHGNFNPENTITRAEAAAIIYRLRNGGSDDASLWVGSEPFTDVADGEWYAGYIAWCYNYGIIDGVSATLFNPKQPIKGTELAKMLLATAGYKSDIEGYVGANWEKNVIEDATAAGLFDKYGLGFVKPAARQWAALMIVNALSAEEAAYLGDYRLPTGGETLGEKYLGLAGIEDAIVIANDTWSVVNGGSVTTYSGSAINGMARHQYVTEAKLAAKDKILVAPMSAIKDYKAGTLSAADFYANWTAEIETKDDSIVGQEIAVAFKDDGTVLGYTVTGDTVSGKLTISKGTSNDTTVYTAKIGAKVYIDAKAGTTKLADGIYQAIPNPMWSADKTIFADKAIYLNRGIVDVADLGYYSNINTIETYYNKVFSLVREGSFTAYDFDGDKTIDAVINNPVVYTRASTSNGSVGPTWDVGNHNNTRDGGWYTFNAVSGLKAETIYKETFDYTTMQMSFVEKPFTVAKLEEIETDSTGAIVKVTIGGTKYTFATEGYLQYCANQKGNLAKGAVDSTWNGLLGKLVKFVADDKGNLVWAFAYTAPSGTTTTTPTTLDTAKLAYFIEAQDVTVSSTSTDEWGNVTNVPVIVKKIKVMYANGTTEILTYDVDSTASGAIKDVAALVAGKVYEYAINADGEIVLFTNLSKATQVIYGAGTSAAAVAAGTCGKTVTYSLEKNRFGDVLVNDNTLVFVKYTTKVNKVDTVVYTTMKMSEFKKGIDGQTFTLIARDTAAISSALVVSVDFGANDLPVDPAAPAEPAGSYLVYVTGGTVKYNLGADEDGNPVNVAKFTAIDIVTGAAGDYYMTDIAGAVTVGSIIKGQFNDDGLIEAAPTTVTISDFAGSLTASSYLKGKAVAKNGDLLLVDSTLLDASNFAKNYKVICKTGSGATATFAVSSFDAIKLVASGKDNNIVLRTDAEGKIDLVMFTSNGNAF